MTVGEVFAFLTLSMGFSPGYVLDEMTLYERDAIFKYSFYRHKDLWESVRLNAYTVAKANGSKAESMEDFIAFPWEDEHEQEEIKYKDIEEMKRDAEAFRKQIIKAEKRLFK